MGHPKQTNLMRGNTTAKSDPFLSWARGTLLLRLRPTCINRVRAGARGEGSCPLPLMIRCSFCGSCVVRITSTHNNGLPSVLLIVCNALPGPRGASATPEVPFGFICGEQARRPSRQRRTRAPALFDSVFPVPRPLELYRINLSSSPGCVCGEDHLNTPCRDAWMPGWVWVCGGGGHQMASSRL